jgi:hypothetical protein
MTPILAKARAGGLAKIVATAGSRLNARQANNDSEPDYDFGGLTLRTGRTGNPFLHLQSKTKTVARIQISFPAAADQKSHRIPIECHWELACRDRLRA